MYIEKRARDKRKYNVLKEEKTYDNLLLPAELLLRSVTKHRGSRSVGIGSDGRTT